ncbi:hypothetical protein FRC11_007125 [Ceratobasidium sp. 423]|nr:hypothetical protein FRC11_007125 [Ceratobasidium sp. 423]
MRIFVRFPHVKKIYFGGGHDNGYTSNLATLQTEGYLDKIVLLQGYTEVAAEIKTLPLERLKNNGLFFTEKLSNKTVITNATTPTPALPIARAKSAGKSPAPTHAIPIPPKSPIKVPTGKNSKANVAALKEECHYGHDYVFSPEMLADFRELVRQNPCLLANKGKSIFRSFNTRTKPSQPGLECKDTECPSAHLCPQGPGCSWHKEGSCKFVARGMHGSSASSEDEEDRVLVAPAPRVAALHARTGSSSSSVIDFPDYPASSPSKRPTSRANNIIATHRAQVKNAFKNSVNGTTPKERLLQMGVGSAAGFSPDEDSDSSEPVIRGGVLQFPNHGSPNKYGIANGRRVNGKVY